MKQILLITILLLNVSCINLNFFRKKSFDKLSEAEREEKVNQIYSELDVQYYKMLEDEIKENDRKSIEEEYKTLKQNLISININKSSKEHIDFLNKYNKEINLKLQYLKDLE